MCEGGHAAEGLQAGLCPEPAWAQPSGELQMHRMASRGQQQAVPPVMLTPAPGKALLYLVLIWGVTAVTGAVVSQACEVCL